MRRAAKTDFNQAAIVAGLRSIGASVQILAAATALGDGSPSLGVRRKFGEPRA